MQNAIDPLWPIATRAYEEHRIKEQVKYVTFIYQLPPCPTWQDLSLCIKESWFDHAVRLWRTGQIKC